MTRDQPSGLILHDIRLCKIEVFPNFQAVTVLQVQLILRWVRAIIIVYRFNTRIMERNVSVYPTKQMRFED